MSPHFEDHPKIQRAEEHLIEFNRACAEFVRAEPYRIIKRTDYHEGRRRKIEFDKSAPALVTLALIFGDFIHNLRSALDHMVGRLVIHNGKNRRRSSFPIVTDRNQWVSTGASGRLGGLAPEAVTIIEGLQPYHAVDGRPEWHPLALLSRLDNRDKHHQLNLTICYVDHLRGSTRDGGYWLAPAPRFQDQAPVEASVPQEEMDLKPAIGIALAREGPAPYFVLWTPPLPAPWVAQLLGDANSRLLPEVLLASVFGSVLCLDPGRGRLT